MMVLSIGSRIQKAAIIMALVLAETVHAQIGLPNPSPAPIGNGSNSEERLDDTVVVIGQRLSESAKVRELVGAITRDVTFDKPIARYADPVCFAVAGLGTAQGVEVADRLVADAQGAGVRMAGVRCTPNVFVLFVDDDRKEISQLWKRRPQLFGSYSLYDVRRMLREPGPVHAILTNTVRGRDGDRIVGKSLNVATASQIDLPIRIDIDHSILIVNRNAIIGLNLRQIADYAAMRTLANLKSEGGTGGRSILGIFSSPKLSAPSEMTVFDREYLKAIYSGTGNVRGPIKVGQIFRAIMKASR